MKHSGFLVILALFVALMGALPMAAQASVGAAALAQADTYYVVRSGDTLARIAARFGTTVAELLEANPQITNPNRIYAGQRLRIPGEGTSDGAQRISFAAGATSASRQATVAAGGTHHYVLKAMKGQQMEVDLQIQGIHGDATLVIYGADGDVLVSGAAKADAYRGLLRATQDYFIDVRSLSTVPTNYVLQVIIPQRINFAAGAISGTDQGYAPAYGTHHYVLRAAAGQTMTVDTWTTQGQVILIIYGEDGDVLISDHAGATSWEGTLPATQDYFIHVRSVLGGTARYTLQVTIR